MGKFELKVPEGKLLKVTCETENKVIKSVKISGDFFLHPEESIVILEKNLVGATIDRGSISKIVGEFIQKGNIFIGIEVDHIVEATLRAAQPESN